jgi:tRNA1(Val) A37 N6-methylase TrmN6
MNSNPEQRPIAAPPEPGTTDDRFLGGRLNILQPETGFRAGLDSVVLAASVLASPGDDVCDVGAGVGTAGLCLSARVGDLAITAIEIDEGFADLCRKNYARNATARSCEIVVADVLMRPKAIARQAFDHVLTNPPYFDAGQGTPAPQAQKARATSIGKDGLVQWLDFARTLVRPKGTLTAIVPPEQLALALGAMSTDGQGCEIIPLWPAAGHAARRLIIRTQINSRAPLRLWPGLVLHDADGKPASEAEGILRHGNPLTT